jgi:hypothetical protein
MSETITHPRLVDQARAIMAINSAYFQSKALQTAVELGIFGLLASGPATGERVSEELGLRHLQVTEFLDALASLGLLEADAGQYRNSEAAAEFLVPGRPRYLGGSILQHSRLHYHTWGHLTEALRDGHAKFHRQANGTSAFSETYQDPARARNLMSHMDAFNSFVADELASRVDWSGYASFLDVGGARGNVAAQLVTAHPHLAGGVFDLPGLRPLFEELMSEAGTADQVRFYAGDFWTDPLPAADVLIIGHVLHDWPAARRRELVARTYPSVHPGGILLIYDAMLADDHRDARSLLQCLNCSMVRDGGSEYTVSECRDYAEQAGYQVSQVITADTITGDRFVIAAKPGS